MHRGVYLPGGWTNHRLFRGIFFQVSKVTYTFYLFDVLPQSILEKKISFWHTNVVDTIYFYASVCHGYLSFSRSFFGYMLVHLWYIFCSSMCLSEILKIRGKKEKVYNIYISTHNTCIGGRSATYKISSGDAKRQFFGAPDLSLTFFLGAPDLPGGHPLMLRLWWRNILT